MFTVQEIEIDKIEIGAHATTWAKARPGISFIRTHTHIQGNVDVSFGERRWQLCMKPNEHRFNMLLLSSYVARALASSSAISATASKCVWICM